jgi:hypothetical protein
MSRAEGADAPREAAQVARFLRALAERAEGDPALAAALLNSLEESGLLSSAGAGQAGAGQAGAAKHATRQPRARAGAKPTQAQPAVIDPFAIWRAHGEDGLVDALDGLDLAGLRAVVRAYRLDPARVSSRWTARDRVAGLIVAQVKARLNHGRAFERV